jgi:hypothetical protein
MTARKCSTCKHYEPAPIWRMGWCRNPTLYAPQQSHLVGEDDLDCERGMGNYWEPAEQALARPDVSGYAAVEQPLTVYAIRPRAREIYTSTSGQPVYSVSGSSGYGGEPPSDSPGDRGGRTGGPPSGQDRQFTYYPEQHSWLDYVRVAAPILGVILIVIFAWIWISASFLGDDDETDDSTGGVQTATTTLPFITATATTTVRAGATGTPRIVETAPPVATTPVGGEVIATEPVAPVGDIYAGATVEVANTDGTGANMRTEPTTDAEVIAVLLDGTQLTTTGESVEAAGFVWWPVEGDAGAGWVVADFLVLIQ